MTSCKEFLNCISPEKENNDSFSHSFSSVTSSSCSGYTPLEEDRNHLIGNYKVYDHLVRFYPSEHRVINMRTGRQKTVNAHELYNILITAGISKEEIFDTIPNVKISLEQLEKNNWKPPNSP